MLKWPRPRHVHAGENPISLHRSGTQNTLKAIARKHGAREVRHSHTEAATEYFVETCAFNIVNTFSINFTSYFGPESGTSFLTLTAERPPEACSRHTNWPVRRSAVKVAVPCKSRGSVVLLETKRRTSSPIAELPSCSCTKMPRMLLRNLG